jgi:C4-dicarboxylate-specific signal transduction histidine kinase
VIRRLRERTKRPLGAVVACSLPELVRGVAETLKDKLDAAGVELRTQWNADPALVMADPVQVEIIVSNLLRNAAEAIAESGAAVRRIEVTSEPAGADRIAMIVSDSGPGISEGALSEMFELLHSTRSEGTGLGLWLSRCLAETNGGALGARRNPSGGMSFVLELPRAEGAGKGASGAASPEPRTADGVRTEEAPHVS